MDNRTPPKGMIATVNWSVDYDGKSVLEAMTDRPKIDYWTLNNVIKSEGGFIDDKGIIHKGSAKNKIGELY